MAPVIARNDAIADCWVLAEGVFDFWSQVSVKGVSWGWNGAYEHGWRRVGIVCLVEAYSRKRGILGSRNAWVTSQVRPPFTLSAAAFQAALTRESNEAKRSTATSILDALLVLGIMNDLPQALVYKLQPSQTSSRIIFYRHPPSHMFSPHHAVPSCSRHMPSFADLDLLVAWRCYTSGAGEGWGIKRTERARFLRKIRKRRDAGRIGVNSGLPRSL